MTTENQPNANEGTEPVADAAYKKLMEIAAREKELVNRQQELKKYSTEVQLGQKFQQLQGMAKENPLGVLQELGIDPAQFAPKEQPDPYRGRLEKLEQQLADAAREREEQARRESRERELDDIRRMVVAHITSAGDSYPALTKTGSEYHEAVFNKLYNETQAGNRFSEADAASYVNGELIKLATALQDLVKREVAPTPKPNLDLGQNSSAPDQPLSRNQSFAALIEAAKAATQ